MKYRKLIRILAAVMVVAALCCVPALAAGAGDVAAAVESTWKGAATQIKTVVEKVVFPALDMVLAIAFFTKLGDPLRLPGLHPHRSHLHLEHHRDLTATGSR